MVLFTAKKGARSRPADIPERFEALADTLYHNADGQSVCQEIGRRCSADGLPLDEVLAGLERTYQAVTAGPPPFAVTRTVAVAWSEDVLGYLHAQPCEDPLTGLASMAHLRSRLQEIYREGERVGVSAASSHALTVVDIGTSRGSRFDQKLRLVDVVELLRAVYTGGETIGELKQGRIGVVVARDKLVAEHASLARELLIEWEHRGDPPAPSAVRVWIEGLPAGDGAVDALLDELAR